MISHQHFIIGLACAFLTVGAVCHASTSTDYELFPMALDAAGGSTASADYALDSATGQPAGVGDAVAADYEAWYGFIPMLGEAPGVLVVIAPNGGESWPCGTTQAITWVCNDLVAAGPEVRVGLHKGAAFIDWIVRRTANDGAYNWIVWTDLEAGDDYQVRVQSYSDASVNDYSDAYFTITPLGVLVPNGDETWTMGDVNVITWASNAAAVGADVRIGLHKGTEFLEWINRSTANDGSYFWKIPATYEPGYGYRIRVQSYADAAIKDLSDAPFTLELPPLLWISPDFHDDLTMGNTYAVTWQCNDFGAVGPDVRIGLHKGGAFIDWMIRSTDNDGDWDWTVPTGLTPAPSYRLRLQSYTDKNVRTMGPAFTISSP
ncbi:MAG TPA: hypothetical protein PLO37_17765 [Candidatus Hydrogenedentes bacterium]|nr:hypothetical protein [Candidatus Hydrogenedentota bacterium]HPG68697.1 hypothetical protein [Candidatus Hydrogenedentota bacterium]